MTLRRLPNFSFLSSPFILLLVLLTFFTAISRAQTVLPPPGPSAADEAYRFAVGLHNVPLYREAEEKFRLFLKEFPNDPRTDRVLYRLGDCLIHLDRREEAADCFRKVLERFPKSELTAESLFRLAELSHLLEQPEEACRLFDRFIKQFPNHTLSTAAREKERAAALAALYQNAERVPEKALALANNWTNRSDSVGEEALFLRGVLLFNGGQSLDAARSFEMLLARFPQSSRTDEARFAAAQAYLRREDWSNALRHLEGVQTNRLDETGYWRGVASLRLGRTNEALNAFDAVVRNHPRSEFRPFCLFELGALGRQEAWTQLQREYPKHDSADESRFRMAAEFTAAGRTNNALQLLESVASDSPRRTEADLMRIELLAPTKWNEALSRLTELEKRGLSSSRLTRAHYAVGLAALENNKPDETIRHLSAVLQATGNTEIHPDCHYRIGLAWEQKENTNEATSAYRRALNAAPKGPLAPYVLLRLAALEMEQKPEQSLLTLQRLGTDFPDFPYREEAENLIAEIRYRQGWSSYRANQFLKAADWFEPLMGHPRYGAEAAHMAGLAWQQAGRPADAERCFSLLLQKWPAYKQSREIRELLGALLIEQKKWADASRLYGEIASGCTNPAERARAELQQGMALHQINQPVRARECFLFAAEHGAPADKAKALFFLGEQALLQKKPAEAKEFFLKCALLYRDDDLTPAALLQTGRSMLALGEKEQAAAIFQQLKKDYPRSSQAAECDRLLK